MERVLYGKNVIQVFKDLVNYLHTIPYYLPSSQNYIKIKLLFDYYSFYKVTEPMISAHVVTALLHIYVEQFSLIILSLDTSVITFCQNSDVMALRFALLYVCIYVLPKADVNVKSLKKRKGLPGSNKYFLNPLKLNE